MHPIRLLAKNSQIASLIFFPIWLIHDAWNIMSDVVRNSSFFFQTSFKCLRSTTPPSPSRRRALPRQISGWSAFWPLLDFFRFSRTCALSRWLMSWPLWVTRFVMQRRGSPSLEPPCWLCTIQSQVCKLEHSNSKHNLWWIETTTFTSSWSEKVERLDQF